MVLIVILIAISRLVALLARPDDGRLEIFAQKHDMPAYLMILSYALYINQMDFSELKL
jgi:hypothetical protein